MHIPLAVVVASPLAMAVVAVLFMSCAANRREGRIAGAVGQAIDDGRAVARSIEQSATGTV